MNQMELRTILNQELAVSFGQVSQYFDTRFEALEQKLDGKVGIYIYSA